MLKAYHKSLSDERETPTELFERLNTIYNFTLDPCSTKRNAKCKKYYTKKQDGLSKDWSDEIVFCNPPYSEWQKWVKAVFEHTIGYPKLVVFLLAARTDTKAFHNYLWGSRGRLDEAYAVRIDFLEKRLIFETNGKPMKVWSEKEKKYKICGAPFPSMLAEVRRVIS